MSSFFNVSALGEIRNPFSTPVGQRIDQATDATLASENWALNMEICDMINESSDTARDAMKAIRKKLQQNAGKNYTVIMYTLTVLETCVKNCGKAFHMLVAQKDFIQELVKLIGPKNDPPAVVQEKVLNLIQIWADTFRSTAELNGVVQVYQELKNKGIEFPPADLETMAPIYTPQRSVPAESSSAVPQPQIILPTSPQHNVIQLQPGSPAIAGSPGNVQPLLLNQQQHQQQQQQQQQMHHQQQQQQQHQQQIVNNGGGGGPGMNGNMIVNAGPVGAGISIGPINTTPEQNAKIQSELDIVSLNMSILSDMLNELKPGQEDPSDYRLLIELTNTCKEMQGRIVELIGRINHDEITAELLRLNDELNNLFLRQQRYEKNHDPQTATVTAATTGNIQSPSAILGAAMGVPITTNGASGAAAATAKDSLIDLSDEPNGGTDQLTSKFSGLGTSQLSQINSVSAQSGGSGTTSTGAISRTKKDVDEFDMFAQSRNTTIGGTKELAASGDDDINNSSNVPIALGSSQSQSQSTKHQPKKSSEVNANESDFDEMAAWLEKADEEDDGPEESLTSKEFDRFLAERAAAADQLPTITPSGLSSTTTTTTGPNNTTPTSTPQRQKNGKNKEEVSLMAL